MAVDLEASGVQARTQDALNNYGSADAGEKSDASRAFSEISKLNVGNAGGDLAKAGAEEGDKFKAIGQAAVAAPTGLMSDAMKGLSQLAQLPEKIVGNLESGLKEIASGVGKLANPL